MEVGDCDQILDLFYRKRKKRNLAIYLRLIPSIARAQISASGSHQNERLVRLKELVKVRLSLSQSISHRIMRKNTGCANWTTGVQITNTLTDSAQIKQAKIAHSLAPLFAWLNPITLKWGASIQLESFQTRIRLWLPASKVLSNLPPCDANESRHMGAPSNDFHQAMANSFIRIISI